MIDVWNNVIHNPDDIRFIQAEFFSPYCEAVEGAIKEAESGIKTIEINSFYRYDEIFSPLLESDISDVYKNFLFDLIMHLTTRLELKNGLNHNEFQVRKFWNDLANGSYGAKCQKLFDKLDEDSQYMIASGLVSQMSVGESVKLFSEMITKLIGDGVVYKNAIAKKDLLLCLGKTATQKEQDKIELVKELFLPLGYKVRVYENQQFGIMGEDVSMEIDEIVLF